MTPRLREVYANTVVPALTEEFSYCNPMEVPRLDKIVINMGVGDAPQDRKRWKVLLQPDDDLRSETRLSRVPRSRSPASSCAKT